LAFAPASGRTKRGLPRSSQLDPQPTAFGGTGSDAKPRFQFQGWAPSARRRHTTSRTSSYRGAELTTTLLSYFDCNPNAKETALRLQIRVNTARQRLATIEHLLGHWGQASRALEIHVALRLWSLGDGRPAAGH
jgi:hypothetical protein